MNKRAKKAAKKLARVQRRARKLHKAMKDFERVIECPHEHLSDLTDDARRIRWVYDGKAEAALRMYRSDPFDHPHPRRPDEF